MKSISFICSVLLLLCTLAVKAQDVITFSNGEEVAATITEVNDLKVKYKLFNNIDTTIRIAKTSSVFMIKYANGTKQVFGNPLSTTSQDANKLADEEIARMQAKANYDKYNKAYKYKRTVAIVLTSIGAPVLATGIPLLAVGYVNERKESMTNGFPTRRSSTMYEVGGLISVAGFTLTLTGGIHFALMAKYKKKRDDLAAQLSLYPTTQTIQPVGNIGGSYSGLAVRITF